MTASYVFEGNVFDSAINVRPVHCQANLNEERGIRLFRSATPASYSDRDWQLLAERFSVSALVDLRDISEVERDPVEKHAFKAGISYHCCALSLERPALMRKPVPTEQDYADYYQDILDSCAPSIGLLLNWISETNPLPLVVSCYAGKDRTSIIIYLILSILEESWQTIARDYLQSTAFLHSRLDYFSQKWESKGLTRRDYERRMFARPGTIESFHKQFKDRFGSYKGYLATIGIGSDAITRIKANFELVARRREPGA